MKDNKFDIERMNRLREKYEGTHMTEKQLEAMKKTILAAKQQKRKEYWKKRMRLLAAAAAAMAVFIILPNTSPVIANAMQNIPVLGEFVRVVTFRSYTEEKEDMSITVAIPSLETIKKETAGLADSVNREIYTLCEEYSREAVQRAMEYKEAFMATGGTQEEWEAHNIRISVEYEIKSQSERYLSFVVIGSENWNSGSGERRYYNFDLQKETRITLKDVLGEEYADFADAAILEQMKERERAGEVFFSPEEGGFAGIKEDTRFYMNEAGNPVIVFDKYEIAPGSAGEVEFEIKSRENMSAEQETDAPQR